MVSLFSFGNFMDQVAAEYGAGCKFAFIALPTPEMRFPTFEMPDALVECRDGGEGVELVFTATPNSAPLTVQAICDVVADNIDDYGGDTVSWVFVDAAGNTVFETDTLEDYEYSVTQPDGYKSTHSF